VAAWQLIDCYSARRVSAAAAAAAAAARVRQAYHRRHSALAARKPLDY